MPIFQTLRLLENAPYQNADVSFYENCCCLWPKNRKIGERGLKLDFRTCSLHVGWCYFALMKHERLLPFNFDARRTTRILTNGATAAMALCDNNPFRTSSNCLSTKFTRRLQPTLKGSSKYRQQEVSTFLSIENLSPTIQSSNEKKETSTIIIHRVEI